MSAVDNSNDRNSRILGEIALIKGEVLGEGDPTKASDAEIDAISEKLVELARRSFPELDQQKKN